MSRFEVELRIERRYIALYLAWYALVITVGLSISAVYAAGIPAEAARYRLPLIQTVQAYCGLGCPVADFAAQIHAESRFRADAKSAVGALGPAQFMPATASWISGVYPADLSNPRPADPQWAMRALVLYDGWLMARIQASTPCDRSAKAKSAYNGGLGWVYKGEKIAKSTGLDAGRWWGNVERVNDGRAAAALRENRDYPRRILIEFSPLYVKSGWGKGVCA